MRIASTADLSDRADIAALKEKMTEIQGESFKHIRLKGYKSTVSRYQE